MTIGLLLFRLLIGLTLAAHGSQKLFGLFGGGGIAGTGAFFENHLNFRPGRVHATMAGASELGGGLLLVLGLLTPVAAASIVGVMVVAGWSAHGDKGFFITKGGYEYTAILGGAGAVFAFVGPGRFSIDHALGWDLFGTVWGFVALLFGAIAGACVMAGRRRLEEPEPSDATLADGREAAMERSDAREESRTEATNR